MIIKLHKINVQTFLGIYPDEQLRRRTIEIDLNIDIDHNPLVNNFSIENTVDYDHICQKITDLIGNNKFKLIEEIAYKIVCSIMADTRISALEIEVHKISPNKSVQRATVCMSARNENQRIIIE